MPGYSLTTESARRLAELLERAKYQPPARPRTRRTADHTVPGMELYKFTMTEDMGTDSGTADILSLEDDSTIESDADLVNTLGDFSHLLEDDSGLCLKSGDTYYAIHPEEPGKPTVVAFTLTSDLTTSATALVSLTSDTDVVGVGDAINLVNPTSNGALSGAVGTAIKAGADWYVLEVDRAESLIHITLTCNSHDWTVDPARGFNADQTVPITYSFAKDIGTYPVGFNSSLVVSNPYNLNWKNGDRALLRMEDEENYFVVKVFRATCLRFRFVLTADAPNGLTPNLTATALCPINSDAGGEPPSGTLTIKDLFYKSHNAKTGHKGIAEYDFNNDWYVCIECEHTATLCKGLIYANFSATPTNIGVDNVAGLNGPTPSYTTLLNVANRYSWESGTSGHTIEFRWDPIAGEYYPTQMRCPS